MANYRAAVTAWWNILTCVYLCGASSKGVLFLVVCECGLHGQGGVCVYACYFGWHALCGMQVVAFVGLCREKRVCLCVLLRLEQHEVL